MRIVAVLGGLGAALLLVGGNLAVAQRGIPPAPVKPTPLPRFEPLPRYNPPRMPTTPSIPATPRFDPPGGFRSAPTGPSSRGYPNGSSNPYGSGQGATNSYPTLPTWPDGAASDFARSVVQSVRSDAPKLRARLLSSVSSIAIQYGDIPVAPLSDDDVRAALAEAVQGRMDEVTGRYASAPSPDTVVQFVQSIYASEGPRMAFVAADAQGPVRAYASVIDAINGVVGPDGSLSDRTIVVANAVRLEVQKSIPQEEVDRRGRPAFYAPETEDDVASGQAVEQELRQRIASARELTAGQMVVIDLTPRSADEVRVWGFADYEARRYADVGNRFRSTLEGLAGEGADVRRPTSREQIWRILQRAQKAGMTVVIIGEANTRNAGAQERRVLQIPGTRDVLRRSDFHGFDKARLIGLFCHSRDILGGEAGGFNALIMGRDAIRGMEAVRVMLKQARLVMPVDARPALQGGDTMGGAPVLRLAYAFMHAFDEAAAAAGGEGSGGPPPPTWTWRVFADEPDDDGGIVGFLQRVWWSFMGLFAGKNEAR